MTWGYWGLDDDTFGPVRQAKFEYVNVPEEERGDWDDEDWDNYHAEVEAGGLKFTQGEHPIVDQIHHEFNDWWDNGGTPGKSYDPDGLYEGEVNRGPIGHWPTVENFLKDRYPAAYRGLGYGHEEAKVVLDNEGDIYRSPRVIDNYNGESDPRQQPKPYETGQDAINRHGYDPKEVVSAAMYLHNMSRGINNSYTEQRGDDGARLWNIAEQRHRMQRDYEQRQPPNHTAAIEADVAEDLMKLHEAANGYPGHDEYLRQTAPTNPNRPPRDYHYDWRPPVDDDGMVTLYHRTSPGNADAIVAGQRFHPDDDGVWFATHPDGVSGYDLLGKSYQQAYGDAVVRVRVPEHKVYFSGVRMDSKPGDVMHARVYPEDLDGVPITRHAARGGDTGHGDPVAAQEEHNLHIAMPSRDAYDYMVMEHKRKTDDIPEQGEFYHGSDHEHQPGDILESARVRGDQDRLDYYEKSVGAPNHADWVWMYNHPAKATRYHKNVYQLEPLDEGPWIWNNYKRDDGSFSPGENDEDFPRLVSPRARVIRKLSPEEYNAAADHLQNFYDQWHAQRTSRFVTAAHEHVESGQPGRPDWTGCAHPECRPDLPTTMYHVSHPKNRDSIAQHGLLTSYSEDDELSDALGMPHGVYMTSDEPKLSHDTERWPGDVWSIDTTKLKHLENDFPGGMLFRNAFATKYDVPPEAMRLHRPSAHHTASRLAMPNPLPQGVHFRYHPELMWSPGVTAHYQGQQIGSLEWYDDDHVMVDLGSRRPGEIDRISVHPDHRGNSVATKMFDFAKQYEPRLHHSEQLTEDGRGWSEYEKSRTAARPRRFTQDWQQVGFDLMPVEAVAHYMQRKETGFGDEKRELYELNKQPPLSEQVKNNGYEKAVHLVTDGRSGSIYDGHHRIDIARQLGHTHIPVEVSWRTPNPDGSPMFGDSRIEPWLKGWLTDMRRGRETVGVRTALLAGLNGELPQGLTFRHHPAGSEPFPDVIQPSISVTNSFPAVSAWDGDRMVGHLQWHGDHPRKRGEIWDVRVHPDYQRRGIGTAMFDYTTDQIEPDLHHSPNLSDEGRAFMEAEEARPLARERYEAWRNGQPMPKRFATTPTVDKVLQDWTDTRDQIWQDGPPRINGTQCPKCRGTGYLKKGKPANSYNADQQCMGCAGLGRLDKQKLSPTDEDVIDPFTNRLEDSLYQEFMDWWPDSQAAATRNAEDSGTGWAKHPHEPITHWLNVEDFLSERYPEAATGGKYGLEHATPMLHRVYNDTLATPEELENWGYLGHGNVVTQAMLNLHNRLQNRIPPSDLDQRRYYELMLRHVGPDAKRLARLVQALRLATPKRLAMAWQDWEPKITGGCRNGCYHDADGEGSYGEYQVYHGPGLWSTLNFAHDVGRDGVPELYVTGIHTSSDYRNDGVAESLMRRMHEDHPDIRINPGFMTDDGEAFHNRMLEKEPDARGIVTAGRNGDPPPMTFEPFNTMWTNGIMARHAEDGRPLAHLHWYPDGEIETIRVHPEMRGRGVGKAILTHAVMNPETYEAQGGIKPSNHLTPEGRAFANSLGHVPSDEEVTPAEGEHDWAWKAVQNYVPMHVPYNGQNEDEMSRYLEQPWEPPARTASVEDEGWPVWWRNRHRPAGPFDKRWHPNHPEHVPAPWAD